MSRSPILALTLVWVTGGCIDFGAHTCTQDAQCNVRGVEGTCVPQGEASGYCALPDDTCDGDLRYVPEAGDLAGSCVDAGGTGTSSNSASGTDPTMPTGSESNSTGETDSAGTDPTMPAFDCIDADGDGYGEGADCMGPDCDDGHSGNNDQCIYISPSGDDTNEGTRAEPLRHFSFALPLLDAAVGPKSLVMLPGEYTPEITGRLCLSSAPGECPYTVKDGQESAEGESRRLRLTTDVEGSVLVLGPDNAPAVELRQVQHWSLQRFTAARPAGATMGMDALALANVSWVDVRRVVVARGSENDSLFEVKESGNVDVVECSVHDLSAERGFFALDSHHVHIRRSYAHLESESTTTTTAAFRAQAAEEFTEGPIIMTNVVGEGGQASVRVDGGFAEDAVQITGSVFIGAMSSLVARYAGGPELAVYDTVLWPSEGGTLVGVPDDPGAQAFGFLSLERVSGSTDGVGAYLSCSDCVGPYTLSAHESVIIANETLIEIGDGDVETNWAFSFEGTAIGNDAVIASFPIPLPVPIEISRPQCWIDPTGAVFNDRGARIVVRTPGPGEDPGPLWGENGEFPCPLEYEGADFGPTGCRTVHERIGVDGATCPTR